ncbi:MAG: iron ABC transporter permease [Gammaproteobacteria bacterium]|jgi:iron(III) transport system permease protein|nr:iron ABC transporter permease [Gammaproteobacteria bacterium]MBU0826855.1 iron ABC transporter permease [Gammaproteobacteria bacterium]MBU0891359.1 iron ABC transporter permease [Gammaproteobacteria bacterium]MBU1352881.1 iron ABC transporter permease [Gammaproteobacteria bacterium]MBU1505679.1 iron ABC transporter permease [Gammaproteobacteria bacterium]
MSAVYSEPGATGPGAARPRLLHALTGLGPWLAFGVILAFLAIFLLIPVGLVVYTAFINETGGLTMGHFGNFFAQDVFRESFFNSLIVSLASVFFASLIAVPLAYLTVRFEFRGALLIQTLGVLPLIMPPFVGAVALQLIFGRNGSINLLLNEYFGFTVPIMDGLVGVTFVESIHYFPFILLNLVASMRNIDGAMEESALNLGARGWRLFRRVIFPLAMPGYLAGAALVFVKVFDDLGTPLVMGVTNMLAPQAYLRITSVGIDDPLGYVISVIMIAFSILALWMAARVMKGKDYATLQKGGSSLQRRCLSAWESVLAYGWIGLILLVTLAPHIGILLMSFSKVWSFSVLPDSYTLEHYATVFTDSKQMVGNTLLYCFIAAGLDVVIGTSIAYLILRTQLPARRWLDYLASAALAIPGLVLAIGYLRMFKGVNLPFTDTPVVTTWVLIMLAYAVRRLPYALRSCMAALQQVHVSLEEVAQSLGASRLSTIRRIMVPLMMGGILAGFVTSFITAAVELSATILLASAQSQAPMSYGIYLYMQSISGRGPGAALGVLAVVVVGLGTYFSHRFVERSRTTVQAKQG